jgi:hypothetical protein
METQGKISVGSLKTQLLPVPKSSCNTFLRSYKNIETMTLTLVFVLIIQLVASIEARYEPNWESINSRPLPSWVIIYFVLDFLTRSYSLTKPSLESLYTGKIL